MIRDLDALAELRKGWTSVKWTQSMADANLAGANFGTGFVTDEFRDVCYNLVLIYAFGVFNDVLRTLRDEGRFPCSKFGLEALMESSKSVLPWVDFDRVAGDRKLRNRIAHKGALAPRKACWDALDAIERELVAWRIIDGPVSVDVTIERRPIT
jgi:hypothetical protein